METPRLAAASIVRCSSEACRLQVRTVVGTDVPLSATPTGCARLARDPIGAATLRRLQRLRCRFPAPGQSNDATGNTVRCASLNGSHAASVQHRRPAIPETHRRGSVGGEARYHPARTVSKHRRSPGLVGSVQPAAGRRGVHRNGRVAIAEGVAASTFGQKEETRGIRGPRLMQSE